MKPSAKIAVFAHSHPFYTKGGGEIVAYNSFRQFVSDGEDALLFCGINRGIRPKSRIFHPGEHVVEYREREFLFQVGEFETFLDTHADPTLFRAIASRLDAFRPSVFHFHHFWNVGTDLITFLRRRYPEAVFAITLHEMLAMCYRDGQMLKTGNNALCTAARDLDCHLCFPEIDKDHFRGRRLYFQHFLSEFDLVISPSEFLAERFTSWGLNKDIYIIENGLERAPAEGSLDAQRLSRRFACFGQASPFKGLDVFISAVAGCAQELPDATFGIYGASRSGFIEQFGSAWDSVIDQIGHRLTFHGPYDPGQVSSLMRQNGWIVVPSTWWENSPLVIQEAFLAGRPPIVADIGGMREKVSPGVTGLHFVARNAASLVEALGHANGNAQLWRSLREAAEIPPSLREMNIALSELYEQASAARRRKYSPTNPAGVAAELTN